MQRIFKALSFAALLGLAVTVPAQAYTDVSVGVSVNVGPPPLPYYPQPFCPGPGYIWTPGYWAYSDDGYFWVPGTWVLAPAVGLLWTPGYWGWRAGYWLWNPGYWGPHVGFYGGINYGYGYVGVGYAGGYWREGAFYYNRAITNVNVTVIHNTYNQTVVNNVSRVSFNGGSGGTTAVATAREESYAREQHVPATRIQMQHEQTAARTPGQRFSANNGHPDVAATAHPAKFNGNGAVRTNATRDSYDYHPETRHAETGHAPAQHAQPHMRAAPRERERGGGHPPHERDGHRR